MQGLSSIVTGAILVGIYFLAKKFMAYTYLWEGAFFATAVLSSLLVALPLAWWVIRKNQIEFNNLAEDFRDPKKIMNYIRLILVLGLVPTAFHCGLNIVNVALDKSPGQKVKVEVVDREYHGSSDSQGTYYIYVKGIGPRTTRLKVRQFDYYNRFEEANRHIAIIRKGALGFAYVAEWLDLPKQRKKKSGK